MTPLNAKRLGGKVAVITGAGARAPGIGNGRATAILFARHGARVALLDISREAAEETARIIDEEGGGDCLLVEADVGRTKDCADAVDEVVQRWGHLDILVNNVGVTGPMGTAVELDLDEWDRGMRTNVTSMMLMARYAIPEMRKVGAGSIVNIASVAGLLGGHPSLLYPTSKGAVVNLTRAMAAHHGREGIRVNCIAPGMVYTPMVYSRGTSQEMREARRQRSLLQNEGTGWDVANGALYLASDDARWVTGVVLPVDAGAMAGWAQLPVPPSAARGS